MKVSLELQSCLKDKSGIGVFTYELAKRLQYSSDIQLEGNLFTYHSIENIQRCMPDLQIKIDICSILPYSIYRRIWHYVPIAYNCIFDNNVDIYHFFNYIVPPRIKGKVITTIHDMTHELYPETMNKRNLKRIKNDINYSIDRADKIITVSESSKNDIIKFLNVDESKIEIVSNGVDYEKFNKFYTEDIKLRVRNKYNLPQNYILYMGTLEPRKNIDSIVEAFSLLKKKKDFDNMKLVIAGKKGWLFENIFDLVNKLDLKEQVIFTDYVDERDKPIIYNIAKLFVFPSIYEGFGIPVLEAMASSVPVITSNVSSLPEVAGDAAVLVNPKDIEDITKNMIEILSNNDFKNELVRKGHIQAQKFTWEDSAEKLYNVYKEVMKS